MYFLVSMNNNVNEYIVDIEEIIRIYIMRNLIQNSLELKLEILHIIIQILHGICIGTLI